MRIKHSTGRPLFDSYADEQYYNDIMRFSKIVTLSNDKIIELLKKYRYDNDIEARNTILENFGRYILAIAKYNQGNGVFLSDMVTEGFIALINAMNSFHLDAKNKFITYCGLFINHAIKEIIDIHRYPVKVPKNIRTEITNFKKFTSNLEQTLGNSVNFYNELQNYIDTKNVRIFNYHIHPHLYRPKNYAAKNTQKIWDEEDDNYEDKKSIPNDQQTNTDYKVEKSELYTDLKRILNNLLTTDERNIIVLYFGLGFDYPIQNIKDIAKKLALQVDYVKACKQKALEKLSSPKIKTILNKYL